MSTEENKTLVEYIAEATKLRAQLEALAARGAFDLSKEPMREAHQRLDKLETFIHTARARQGGG